MVMASSAAETSSISSADTETSQLQSRPELSENYIANHTSNISNTPNGSVPAVPKIDANPPSLSTSTGEGAGEEGDDLPPSPLNAASKRSFEIVMAGLEPTGLSDAVSDLGSAAWSNEGMSDDAGYNREETRPSRDIPTWAAPTNSLSASVLSASGSVSASTVVPPPSIVGTEVLDGAETSHSHSHVDGLFDPLSKGIPESGVTTSPDGFEGIQMSARLREEAAEALEQHEKNDGLSSTDAKDAAHESEVVPNDPMRLRGGGSEEPDADEGVEEDDDPTLRRRAAESAPSAQATDLEESNKIASEEVDQALDAIDDKTLKRLQMEAAMSGQPLSALLASHLNITPQSPKAATLSRTLSHLTSDEDDELIDLETRPATPVGAHFSGVKNSLLAEALRKSSSGRGRTRGTTQSVAAQVAQASAENAANNRDPLRALPSSIIIRIFLQLDIKALARCDRVCKRWRKSSTLNYVWFLHTRALTLPKLVRNLETGQLTTTTTGQTTSLGNNDELDPYDRPTFLSTVNTPLPPSLSTPQWSKRESKQSWKDQLKALATRRDVEEPPDHLRVDVEALSSGYATPLTGGWYEDGAGGSGANSPPVGPVLSKKEAREYYKSLGGRKARTKGLLVPNRGPKDLGGFGEGGGDQYSSPW